MKLKELNRKFDKVKRLLDDDNDNKVEVGGYYFRQKAVEIIKNTNREFFMNSYYNLTISDILNNVLEYNNVEDVKEYYSNEYKEEYAKSWYENFIQVLENIK